MLQVVNHASQISKRAPTSTNDCITHNSLSYLAILLVSTDRVHMSTIGEQRNIYLKTKNTKQIQMSHIPAEVPSQLARRPAG
jgi:hypothetical protein